MKRLVLVFVFTIGCSFLFAQKPKEQGFYVGYGFGENTSDTRYRPIHIAGNFSVWINNSLNNPASKSRFGVYIEPQINPVLTNRPVDVEFGINAGFRYYYLASQNSVLYGMIGSGPHYITAEVNRQAKGFIFSDNAAIGLYQNIHSKNNLYLNFQYRFRHISNAGLKNPNGGINNSNFLIGISKLVF